MRSSLTGREGGLPGLCKGINWLVLGSDVITTWAIIHNMSDDSREVPDHQSPNIDVAQIGTIVPSP